MILKFYTLFLLRLNLILAVICILLRTNLRYRKIKTIQTIATLRDDLFKDSDFEKILFADKIVTYSKYAKEKLIKLGFENVSQVYPGIDLVKYKPELKDKNLIVNLKFKIENFIVTYPGEFVRLGATDDIIDMILNHHGVLNENLKSKLSSPAE